MSKLTISEIAKLAGVSKATASRVLNENPNVDPILRDRVRRVIDENGYVPSAAARNLVNRRTDMIGLLIPHGNKATFNSAFYATMISEIVQQGNERGRLVAVTLLPDSVSEKKLYERVLHSQQFDGVILLAPDMDEPMLPLLIQDRIPFVMFGRHAYLKNITWVDVDNRGAAYTLVSHLIELGHRRIATLAGPERTAWGVDRLDGYKQALVEHGIPVDPQLIVRIENDFSQRNGYDQMGKLLKLAQAPDAIFIVNDYMALGAARAIREAGLKIPEDIALVCFDEFVADSFDVGLTTVPQPYPEMATTAVDLLIAQIENPGQPPVQKVLPMQMTVRESCGAGRIARKELVP